MKLSYFLLIFNILLIYSCEQTPEDKERARKDSIVVQAEVKKYKDRLEHAVDSIKAKNMFDTIGLSKSPVKITGATIVSEQYSHYRNIDLSFKNTSDKSVAGIKFQWYIINVFKDPADITGSYVNGFGSGFTDTKLKSNETHSSEWNILSRDADKVVLAWPYEVIFTDGTKWSINK